MAKASKRAVRRVRKGAAERVGSKRVAAPARARARKRAARSSEPPAAERDERAASARIDARVAELGGWRGRTLQRVREIVTGADPEIVEEWKWENPVWSRGGIVCTGESYAKVVKLTFAKGASLADPARLFDSSLDGKVRRAIDLREGDEIDAAALAALVRAAVARNLEAAPPRAGRPPRLLSGGNPQIPKGDGDGPVQAYLAAIPGWKRAVARRLDALITRAVPGVRKAVKWNSPFYGVDDGTWFLSLHCFAKYVKVAFFRGASLRPRPPGASKQAGVRYLDVREHAELDEARFTSWVEQASRLPGERM